MSMVTLLQSAGKIPIYLSLDVTFKPSFLFPLFTSHDSVKRQLYFTIMISSVLLW